MSPSNVDIHELRRRLYGGDLPGEAGDIPAMRADIADIKSAVNDLGGFYRTVKRVVTVGAALSTIASGTVLVLSALHVI